MTPIWTDDAVTHRFVNLDGVRLHYVEAMPDDPDAPLVVLLHGFPEFWYSWRHQLVALKEAGYRVVAPDLRGYGQSDKPSSIDAYQIEQLAGDLAGLVTALGFEQASIVGHDWGGMIAWWHAMLHPEQVTTLSVLNCPHPGHQTAMLTDLGQLKKSWYMLFFQLPGYPERLIRKDDYAYIRAMFHRDPLREDAFDEGEVQRYVDALDPASTTAALNYYRAYLRRLSTLRPLLRPIDVPTQVLWGTGDRYLGLQYAHPPTRWVWDVRVELLDDVSHWVQVDAAAEVNSRLTAFLPAP